MSELPSWWLDTKQLEIYWPKLAEGLTSTIWKAKYMGREVALKIIKPMSDQKTNKDLEYELDLLSKLHSPYVVQFFAGATQPKLCILMEYCMHGSLLDVLVNEQINITWKHVLNWSIETFKGLRFLHSWNPSVLHRDLKSPNLLVDSKYHVKLSDFGLSREDQPNNDSTLGKLRGTLVYCAPEIGTGARFTTKSDIYSASIVLWELVFVCMMRRYEKPFSEYKISSGWGILISAKKKGLRPTIPEQCPPILSQLIQQCWHPDPSNRPEATEVLVQLDRTVKEFSANMAQWKSVRLPPPQRQQTPTPVQPKPEPHPCPLSQFSAADIQELSGFIQK